jgi:hypothetical protein
MRYKNICLGLLLVLYTIILVHNLTPHRHGANHIDNRSGESLVDWFHLLFGNGHQNDVQDEDHLTKFRLHEDNDLEINSISFLDENLVFIIPAFFHPVLISKPSYLATMNDISYLSFLIKCHSSNFGSPSIGRAPPVFRLS